MVQSTKISCEDSNPNYNTNGWLTLTISSFIGPGDYDTSIFTLNKTTGQLIFSHFYKDIAYTNGGKPKIQSGRSVPFALSPGEHLYGVALFEMLSYAQDHLNHMNNPRGKLKIGIFIKDLEQFLTKQKTEVLK